MVIGRMCREVPPERVNDVILGYTAANDVTARDVQKRRSSGPRAKGFDTSARWAPWVETDPRRRGGVGPHDPVHGQRPAAPARPHVADDHAHRGPDRRTSPRP
ncbi:fumarylacetoacetate hydrolase family protein [Streptomyces sp. KL116D]|uniref:fumarylacetoacetate hydrolase family protein n=1 Tax=Streptomyces sp. KL116D TaxID=3045152 RepID=UPI003555C7F5